MPLLTGAAAQAARDVVADVAATLRDPAIHDIDPALAGMDVGRGSAGAAILFAELAAENGDEHDAETALKFLDRALDIAAEAPPTALLYPGTVGVGWVLSYFEGRLVDADPEENDVDALVTQALTQNWPSNDLIRGVAGAGVYQLQRGRADDQAVTRLAEMSTRTPDGVTWWVDPATCLPDRAEAYPQGYYDVGMAHGQAGVLAVLAHYVAAGVESARPLLNDATQWLLAQRLPDDVGPGRYPSIVAYEPRPKQGSRVAWCYGDAGVAIGLLAAGRALGDDAVVKEAADTAADAAARRGEDAAVYDAPLCHGSMGLVHLFGRLYAQTGDERVADAARHWFDVAMTQHRPSEPVAGWGMVRFDEGHRYEPVGGFLEGAVGVALACLAATSDRAPDWDLLLLAKPVP
ncbi:MAG TPA: lanthionine synthetase C family protein [Frankiaceae bacterium]|nr:lanthionine synthetase C family protein [Frankiaceae bacterium]